MKALTYTLKHFIILVLGVLLALFFAWIVYYSRDLSASVLSFQERQYIEKVHWDAAYKRFPWEIEVFISPQLQSLDQLFVSFLFSPSKLQIFPLEITSPYSFDIISEQEGSLLLEVSEFAFWNVDEGIVVLPFSWDTKEILVEYVTDSLELEGTSFALGSLDDIVIEEHI